MEAYEPSPSFGIAGKKNVNWSYSGQFKEEYQLPDFAEDLNRYLSINAEFGTKLCSVPLVFSSESIGMLKLFDLSVQCEVPTVEIKEEIEGVPLKEQVKDTLDLLEKLKNKLEQILEGLPTDALNEVVSVKKAE